jgi:hypothetical protein
MRIRFYRDPETDLLHIYEHDVTEMDVEQVMRQRGEDRAGAHGSRVAIGRTLAGRILRIIYVRDADGEGIFVITAYELRGKPLIAFRRRKRRNLQ